MMTMTTTTTTTKAAGGRVSVVIVINIIIVIIMSMTTTTTTMMNLRVNRVCDFCVCVSASDYMLEYVRVLHEWAIHSQV